MSLLTSLRAKFSGQTQEQFGDGQRFPLTRPLLRSICDHMPELHRADLASYQFERRHSDYPDSKSDIVVYDDSGVVMFHGRENRDGRVSIWR
jgi:hypothetical protein